MTKLREVAVAIIQKHDGDLHKATDSFIAALLKDRALLGALATDYLRSIAPAPVTKPPKPVSRHRPGPHRRPAVPGMPTESQKASNKVADRMHAAMIFEQRLRSGKKLGDARFNELNNCGRDAIGTGVEHLNRGFSDITEGLLCNMIQSHCVPTDPFAKVRDFMKAEVVMKLYQDARVEAMRRIQEAKDHNRKLFLAPPLEQTAA